MKVLEITCVFSEITVFGENLEIRVFFSPIESKKSSKKRGKWQQVFKMLASLLALLAALWYFVT